jgi:hypothetical protein
VAQPSSQIRPVPLNLKHWSLAGDTRAPWAPASVVDTIGQWLRETEYADELRAAGEKVMPLLLVGESRCGKTSTLCKIARGFGIPAYRMNVASIVGDKLGQTTKAIIDALAETIDSTSALWVLDEADGIFGQRGDASDGATRELNTAMTAALTMIENLPIHVTLAATTNEMQLIDRAMVARFTVVQFPTWRQLDRDGRQAFAKSHGCEGAWQSDSYSSVVQSARMNRVNRIIEASEGKSKR